MDKETFLLECSNPKNPLFTNVQICRGKDGLFTEELLYVFDYRKENYKFGDLVILAEKIREKEFGSEIINMPKGNLREHKDLEKIIKSQDIRLAIKKVRSDFNKKYPKSSIPEFGAYYSSKLHSNKWGNKYYFGKDKTFANDFDGLLVEMMREHNIPRNFFNAIWWWVLLGYIPGFSSYGSIYYDKDRNCICMDITNLSSQSEIAQRLKSNWTEFKSLQEEHFGGKKKKFQPDIILQEVKDTVYIKRTARWNYDKIHSFLLRKGFKIDRKKLRKIYHKEKKFRLKSSSPSSK